MRRLTFLLFAAALAALSACGGGKDAATSGTPDPTPSSGNGPGVLSISANPRAVPAATSSDQAAAANTDAFNMVYGAGARGQVTTYTWKALEPAPRAYDAATLAELSGAIQLAQTMKMTQYVGIQLINTTVDELPTDLVGTDFGDAGLRSRFHGLLDQVVGQHVGQIRYLSIGNEVDAYLSAHPEALAGYTTFFRDALQYAHALDPNIKVGVTGTGDGALGANATLLQNLNAVGSDVVILTYYPLQFTTTSVTVRDPSVVASDFARLTAFAGAKPLVLQEVGYPAAATNQSSQAQQATFVKNVFAAWQAANGKIPFLNVFLLHDFAPQTCADFLTYYNLPKIASFNDYLCTLGLLEDDGTARQSWQALLDAAKEAQLP